MADNVNRIITSTLAPFRLPVAERLYEGKEKEYFFFVLADDTLADSGDDEPLAYVAYMQIHYICPWEKSYADMKRQIRFALVEAGFTPPEVMDLSDEGDRIRHLVFECSIENEYELET